MNNNLEVGDIVMCTVDRIVGTIVFVKIHGNGEGSIILSEIAPGRIRNLRDYVVPKKQIICKVLRISGDRINLSLRRVTPKEQKEIKEKFKQEKGYVSVIKSILKDNSEKIIQEIKNKEEVYDFIEEAKENPKNLENVVGKTDAKKILEIIKTQKTKKVILKKEFKLISKQPDGLTQIKKILGDIKKGNIKYISAGRYSINFEAEDPKTAENTLKEILNQIETQSKKENIEFSFKEK
jgi:translation initiation factor 2 subunit 1